MAQVAVAHLAADACDAQVGLLDQHSPGFLYPNGGQKGLKAHPDRLLKQIGQGRPTQTGLLCELTLGDRFVTMLRQIRQRLLKPRMIHPKARKLPSDDVPSARLPSQPELPDVVDGDEPEGQGEEVLKGLRLNDHPGVEEPRARLKRFQKELHSPERQP